MNILYRASCRRGEGDNAVAGTPTVPGMPVARSHGFTEEESLFFEACSPRKINGIYYLIYSPKRGSRLHMRQQKNRQDRLPTAVILWITGWIIRVAMTMVRSSA